MSREISYVDCLNFIEHKLHIKLFDYQKEIIRCFCEGKEVRTARAIGRSMCADAFGKYITHLYNNNDYSVEPDVSIPYQTALMDGVIDKELIENARKYLSQEEFEREYCSI